MKNFPKLILCLIISGSFVFTLPSFSHAKFTCQVEKVEGTSLILKNCQEKGLKKIKAGDTVSITKKRKKKKTPKVEGC